MKRKALHTESNLQTIWPTIRHSALENLKWIGLVVACSLAVSGLAFLPALLTKDLVDQAIPNQNLDRLFLDAALLLVVPVAFAAISSTDYMARLQVIKAVQSELQSTVMKTLLKTSLASSMAITPGDFLTTVGSDCSIWVQHVLGLGASMLQSSLGLVIALWLLVRVSPVFIVASVVVALSRIPLQRVRAATLRKRNQVQQDSQSVASSLLVESASGIRTLKTYVHEDSRSAAFADYLREVFRSYSPLEYRIQGLNVLDTFLSSLVPAVVYGYGGFLVVSGKFSLGTVLATLQFVSRGAASISSVTASLAQFGPLEAYADRISRFLRLIPERRGGVALVRSYLRVIEARRLSFHYQSDGQDLLREIDLRLERGKPVAVCGASGSGKTTLGYLISGFLRPSQGAIFVGGVDLNCIDLEWYRRHVCLVTDSDAVFPGTILDNLLMARPHASPAEIRRCLYLSTLDEVVNELPKGLETPVGRDESGISSGQRQRLCLARALLYDPEVLILDEVSANLDLRTEEVLLGRLSSLVEEKTVLLLAHRESMLRWAGEVYSLEEGILQKRAVRCDPGRG